MAQRLFEETNDDSFLITRDLIIQHAVESMLDYPGSVGYYNGDLSFRQLDTGSSVMKSVFDNSMMAIVMSSSLENGEDSEE